MKRVLVTGGAGFIGSHLVERLERAGIDVVVLDDFSSGHRENLAGRNCTIVSGDLRDPDAVRNALDGVDGVLHHAAIPSVPGSVEDPIGTGSVNIMGTANLLDQCRGLAVKRIVFASSSAVYGEPESMPLTEDSATRPLSPYGVHKLAGEHLLRVASLTDGIDTVSFRYFNVFGPRQRADSDYAAAIPIFQDKCAGGETPTIYGDGSQTRDFVHVSDVAEANFRALTRDENFGGAVFNLGRGEAIRIDEL
ncbi:MAG: NAD-dependent epimerase/dehydratase family protein, partial [Planctomycetota bacterium]